MDRNMILRHNMCVTVQGQSEQQEQKVDDGWSQWRPELEQNIIMVLRVRGQEVRRVGGAEECCVVLREIIKPASSHCVCLSGPASPD
ncbi:hypothetical protein INR49_006603 [Caranx melampygus]|nr:hypothetical protein INR49_006603 [Caranx melampygus]